MLEVNGLTKKYGKKTAVDEISFSIPDGCVGILLGPNGAGKSTVIKSIAGLHKYEGVIRIQGMDAGERRAKESFAYVPEMPAMYEALSVCEHLEFIKKAYAIEDGKEETEKLLRRFELDDKQEKLGNELSKGMMQKVSLCMGLVIRPKVLLLDEPMVGLDPAAIRELKEIVLEEKKKGTTILISTHMLEMVKELWDIVFIMEEGKIIGSFKRDEIKDGNVEELFFRLTGRKEAV
ncbi:MAG: ABC transporter ATP-binding protein [Clostridiales bacterium]|nr:ABC transporter ATP-binding protein [Clostridiales bacterium]